MGSIPVRLRGGGALNQMIAVDSGRHQRLGQAGGDELEHGHLCSSVLHCHAVCRGETFMSEAPLRVALAVTQAADAWCVLDGM